MWSTLHNLTGTFHFTAGSRRFEQEVKLELYREPKLQKTMVDMFCNQHHPNMMEAGGSKILILTEILKD
ncbi:hypothetical protein scyTo_0012348 [Scyliorhinus torazame]|uniref:Uncharacterized protein n=1 Tax=Scyliorhinus torazame TaxID=75743 RepID=A0A401P786_SCYTO|nr:hypothetical protein [Scyliorhinus torazame]